MELDQIKVSLATSDNQALEYIYLTHGDYCVNSLIKYRQCSKDEAEDLFIESVMNFREKVLNGTIKELTSLRSYLYKTCENKYLARLKGDKIQQSKLSDIEKFYYGSTHYLPEDGPPNENMIAATKRSWEELTEHCKDVIYYFYIEKLSMNSIAQLLDLANANVAKTTKSRCYKNFVERAKQYFLNRT